MTYMGMGLAEKLETLRRDARAAGEPLPVRLPPDTKVFNVPTGLVRILNRDLRLAGIPKRDERGRTIDVHALRHSDPSLTANVHTDPNLLDVAGALDALPPLPLDGDGRIERQRASGMEGNPTNPISALAPVLAPTSDKSCKSQAITDKTDPHGAVGKA